ncbi:MAG: hypothetical protein LBV67_01550 [Streptococcaceae bacterium]|jgi:hypothetical protein|nr:hypothetical protein [Streptococcaceae bacterium]
MKTYNLNDSEKELIKVIKCNQKISEDNAANAQELSDSFKKSSLEAQGAIERAGKYVSINDEDNILNSSNTVKSIHNNHKIKTWDELVAEANTYIPNDVGFEDILTSEEFMSAYRRLDEINEQFARKTKFKKVDCFFLVTAIALQCTRQYVIDPWIKKQRPLSSGNDEKGRKGKTEPGWYHVDTDKILINSVPFDTQIYGEANTIKGFLKGGNHRSMTLGHDPLLGWIFGTANIITGTLTRWDMASVHIKNQPTKRAPNGENVIYSLANTGKVFSACKERVFDEGWDGKLAVGSALIREGIHLKSDIGTKKSIPLPVISSISPDFSRKLTVYGIDMASVSTEIGLSVFINTLISMVHRLFYDQSVDDSKLYEVRTRKILLYSNVIASSSNVVASVLLKNPKILDIGGLIVTIMRLFSDIRFITRVKQEFVQSALDVHFQGIVDELEQMYS